MKNNMETDKSTEDEKDKDDTEEVVCMGNIFTSGDDSIPKSVMG